MTVAVSCNLSEGVILAADSAVTVPTPQGSKVYESAEKLYQLGTAPIGVAIYGLAALGARSIGNYLHEFELGPGQQLLREAGIPTIAEALRGFFMQAYEDTVGAALKKATGKELKDLPTDQLPGLGIVIGGFSPGAYLSEVWHFLVPHHAAPNSSECIRAQGGFGSNWFATCDPIVRYVKGYDPTLIQDVANFILNARGGTPLSGEEHAELVGILNRSEYQVPFVAMPLQSGVEYTRFLTELVVNHHKFTVGQAVVGGRVQVGVVTYRDGSFRLLAPAAGA